MGLPIADDLTIAVSTDTDRAAARTALIKLGAADLVDMLGLGDDHLLDGLAVAETRVAPIDVYKPHAALRVVGGIDWDALTPVCGLCGQRRGDVDLSRMLCASCAKPVAPKPIKAAKRTPRRTSTTTRVPRPPIVYDTAAVIRLYNEGFSIRDVGTQLGMSHTTASRILRNEGVELRGKNSSRAIPRTLVHQMSDEYNSGSTLAVLSERHGFRRQTIHKYLVENGVTMRPAHGIRGRSHDAELSKYDQSALSLSKIAELVGVSKATVVRYRNRNAA